MKEGPMLLKLYGQKQNYQAKCALEILNNILVVPNACFQSLNKRHLTVGDFLGITVPTYPCAF